MALPDKFSFVTVMNVKVVDPEVTIGSDPQEYDYTSYALLIEGLTEQQTLATIDSLSISNITQEGPRKEARGGLYAKPLVRYGKTMRLEMEDVMASVRALHAMGIVDADIDTGDTGDPDTVSNIEINETFPKPIMLVGETFVINKETGDRQWTYVVFPRFLPDGVFDLTMESEGDIGMVNIHGELFPDKNDDFFLIGFDHPNNN